VEAARPRDPEAAERLAAELKRLTLDGSTEAVLRCCTPDVEALTVTRSMLPRLSLRRIVSELPSLTSLSLAGARLGAAGLRVVLLAAARNATLATLDLSGNGGDGECVAAVAAMLSSNGTLRELNLADNSLTTNLSEQVAPALVRNTSLTALRIARVGLLDATALAKAVATSQRIAVLDLSRNTCTAPAYRELCKAVSSGSLTDLNISGCDLDDTGGQSLAEAVRQGRLHRLQCDNTGLSATVVASVMAGLSRSAQVDKLQFVDVGTAKAGAWGGAFGDGAGWTRLLAPAAAVATLNLEACGLDSNNLRTLAAALRKNANLTHLNVSGNEVSLHPLKAALRKRRRRLRMLIAGRNDLTDLFAPPSPDEEEEGEEEEEANPDAAPEGEEEDDDCFGEPVAAWMPECLDLSGSKVDAPCCSQLGAALASFDCKCKDLVLDSCRLDGNLLSKLLAPLVDRVTMGGAAMLKRLVLFQTGVGDAGADALAKALKAGVHVHDLEVGFSNVSDRGASLLADTLTADSHTSSLGLRMNKIRNGGASALAKAISSGACPLRSLDVSANGIGVSGIKDLAASCAAGASGPLRVVDVADQRSDGEAAGSLPDHEMTAVLAAVARAVAAQPDLSVNLSALGGMAEDARKIDSGNIRTDFARVSCLRNPSLQDAIHLSQVLRVDAFTAAEWSMIVGKEAPSWLHVPGMRHMGVLASQMSMSVTPGKLTDLLESEADCGVGELFLVKDVVTKKPTGDAWILLDNAEAVQRALELYYRGGAALYGTPFAVSSIDVDVEGDADVGSEAALAHMALRSQEAAAAEAAERALVKAMHEQILVKQRNWKPCYTDGRIS